MGLVWVTFVTYGSVTALAGVMWARCVPKFVNRAKLGFWHALYEPDVAPNFTS